MMRNTSTDLRPAGRLETGGVRFYSFAPEGKTYRVFEEIRTPSRMASRPTSKVLDSFESAEAFVASINMKATR